MATPYEIDITMAQATVDKLTDNGYQLFAFKGVQSNAGGGQPVIWFTSTDFGKSTKVKWSEQYQGYTTRSAIVSRGSITGANAYNMNLNQTLDVNDKSGTGVVVNGGSLHAISIENRSGVPFTSGISQTLSTGDTNPLCAFPLFGTSTLQIAPIEKVLLMFATNSLNTGTVIFNAFTIGVLIDLTSSNQRQVSYDIDSGWDYGNNGWGQDVTNNAFLAPLLIDTVEERMSSHHVTLLSGLKSRKAA